MLTIIDLLRKKLVNSWGKTVSRQKTEVAPGSFFFLQGNQLTHQLQLQYLLLSPGFKLERVYKISLHTKIQPGNIVTTFKNNYKFL